MELSETKKVKKIFQSISITTFIKYFEFFEKYKDSKDNSFIYEQFDQNKESWTKKSYTSRATKGKKIFRENLDLVALEFICTNSKKIPEETLNKAKLLWNQKKQHN